MSDVIKGLLGVTVFTTVIFVNIARLWKYYSPAARDKAKEYPKTKARLVKEKKLLIHRGRVFLEDSRTNVFDDSYYIGELNPDRIRYHLTYEYHVNGRNYRRILQAVDLRGWPNTIEFQYHPANPRIIYGQYERKVKDNYALVLFNIAILLITMIIIWNI